MREDLAKELEKIGLSENEAKVYLAGLELGPSTAQMIAAKATVSRPTTYIMIESLIKRGLMSSFQKGKKRFFVSGKPTQLFYILEQQKIEIENKSETLKKIIDVIGKQGEVEDGAPALIYEGQEGTNAIHAELLQNAEEVLEIVPEDLVREYIPPIFEGDVRKSFSRRFKIRSLYTKKSGPDGRTKENVEYRYLPPERFPVKTELIIVGDKIFLTNFDGKRLSVHLKSKTLADSFRAIFELLWDQAESG